MINATKDFWNGDIDEETWHVRLKERWKYAVLPKGVPRPDDHARLLPGFGPVSPSPV